MIDVHEMGALISENKDNYTPEEYMVLSEEWDKEYKNYLIRILPENIKKYY